MQLKKVLCNFRQVLASEERKTPAELCAMIESVTPQQLQVLAKRMMESKPSVGAFGDLKNVPNYEVCLAD